MLRKFLLGRVMPALLAAASLSCGTVFGQIGGSSGVYVDADHVLRMQTQADPDGRLMQQRIQAAQGSLNADVAKASELRKVSLNRLEAAVAQAIREGKPLPEEVKHLAGLQRIQYVFFYPETKDIVLAGPAEGWVADLTSTAVGLTNGRPTLLLEDLVVALRAFPAAKRTNPVIGCSIDPTQEGLARLQQFLTRVGRNATPAQTQFLVNGSKDALGLQTVTVMGVPASTRFARVLVEADYRMKLIGIGLEKPAVKMPIYVDLVSPAAVSANAMQRWYFTPDYECVKITSDRHGMQMIGEGVKLVSEDELVSQDGQRSAAGTSNGPGRKFAEGFTKAYPDLAAKSPIYAQLRNMIDLAVAAAFIQDNDLYSKAEWKAAIFGNERLVEVENHPTPERVETAINAIWKGRTLMTPIGGGVDIRARKALSADVVKEDHDGKVSSVKDKIELKLAPNQWWWD